MATTEHANAVNFQRYGSSGKANSSETRADDLAAKGAAAFREAQASVESVIAEAGEKGQQALTFAGQKAGSDRQCA